MSRRSRKRNKAAGKERGSKWLIALVALILLLIIGIGIGQLMIRRYLQSDKFRLMVSAQVGKAIGVEGEFEELKWDGLAVRTDGFNAQGDGPIRSLKVQGVQTEIGLGGFWDGVWLVEGLRIRDVELEVDARPRPQIPTSKPSPASKPAPPKPKAKAKAKKGWLPNQVQLQDLRVDQFSVGAMTASGKVSLSGVRLDVEPGAGRQTYELELMGGILNLPQKLAPEIRIDEASLKYQEGALFITKAYAEAWKNARIEMAGEWDPDHDVRSIQGSVDGVHCDELVNDDWAKRMRGTVSTDFDMSLVEGELNASGGLVVRNGMLTSLPILDVLGAYLDTSRFRALTLSEARADWRWSKRQWGVYNLVIISEGLLQLEGDLTVIGKRIDGTFRLGLAPGTLASIPGAEEHVFLPGERGLRWAPIRVTGTLSEPKHDLSERLVAAAGRRLLEALPEATLETMLIGKNVIDQSSQRAIRDGFKLLDGGAQAIERIEAIGPTDVIEEGAGVIEGGTDIIRGILGSPID